MIKETVLVAGSNATRIELKGDGSAAIGQYLNETVMPTMALIEAGYAVVLATPDGTKPHIDEVSDSAQHFGGDETAYARAKSFCAGDPSMNQVRTLRSVIGKGLDDHAGLFVPGGHAPVVDLMQDADMGAILRHFHKTERPTALLCHGPVATVAAMPRAREFRAALIAGDKVKASECAQAWIYAGYRMTVFSTTEERTAEDSLLYGKLYFTMPEALKLANGEVTTNPVDFAPNVVVDRELITGQNPSSDHLIAAKLVAALDRTPATA